jgi:hypothetical protein
MCAGLFVQAEMAGLSSKIDAIAANLEKLASQSHY